MADVPRYRPGVSALLMGGLYAVFGLVTGFTSLLNIALGAVLLASLGALTTHRLSRGKPMLPTWGMVLLAVAGLGAYTWWAVTDPPHGTEWLAFAFVVAFPIGILVLAYRQWKRTRSA